MSDWMPRAESHGKTTVTTNNNGRITVYQSDGPTATTYRNHPQEIEAMQRGTWTGDGCQCFWCRWRVELNNSQARPTPKLTFATISTDQRWLVVAKMMQLQGCISRHDYYPVCAPGKHPVGAVLDTERAGRWQAAAVRLMFYAAGKR